MERRRFKRKLANLKAEFISGSTSYPGTIENLSEDGIYMSTAPAKTAIDFSPEQRYELKISVSPEETFKLHCEVVWFFPETSPNGLIFSMGISIKDPPEEYKEFLKIL